MVELPQVRQRHLHRTHRLGLFRQGQRRRFGNRTGRPLPHPLQDRFHVVAAFRPALLDGALHLLRRLLRQQTHHADVLLDAAARPMLPFQVGPQLGKQGRQLPAAEEVGVVQRRRLALQRLQIMVRIEALFALAIRARVPGHHLAAGHDRDVVHVALDGHCLKRGRARHAVAVVVEAYGLVFVHLGRLADARIEGKRR